MSTQTLIDPRTLTDGGHAPPSFEIVPETSAPARKVTMNFLEGVRVLTEADLADNDITRYQVTKFYRELIEKSGYYEQLKYIVEPSIQEFSSPGVLDTSGEHDRTVVP